MASAAQLAANRANAQLSTGAKTAEGKSAVSRNALRHGLTAKHLVIREDEREEFTAFQAELSAELDPQGPIETITFDELLHAAWNLRRFRRLEAESSLGSIDDFTDAQTTAVLDRLSRYQARSQRAYYRALRQVKLDEEEAAAVPAIADINHLTEQTHSEVQREAIKQAIDMIEYQTGILHLDAMQNRAAKAGRDIPSLADSLPRPAGR